MNAQLRKSQNLGLQVSDSVSPFHSCRLATPLLVFRMVGRSSRQVGMDINYMYTQHS
jgi:hypothetical protein